jgi:large subunit ribosomal protein L7/L12
MAVSKDEILEAIASMTVMEVVDLISAMEEKFGVTAAAAVAVAPAAAGGDVAAARSRPNSTSCLRPSVPTRLRSSRPCVR